MIGSSAKPFSVSEYSTRGGTSGKVWRSTIPSSSSARRRNESVRGLIPASERSSSQKRERPSARGSFVQLDCKGMQATFILETDERIRALLRGLTCCGPTPAFLSSL